MFRLNLFQTVLDVEETMCTTDGKTVGTAGVINEIFAMSIPVFMNKLGDFGKLGEVAINLIGKIRELTSLNVSISVTHNVERDIPHQVPRL